MAAPAAGTEKEPLTKLRLRPLPVLLVELRSVRVMASGVRPAGPEMLRAAAPVVAMSPDVELMVPTTLAALRPTWLVSGAMSRSAKVTALVPPLRLTPVLPEPVTVVLPKLYGPPLELNT